VKIRDARTIAVEAAERGWIRPHDVWDAACRWALNGGSVTVREVFGDTIDTNRLNALSQRGAETLIPGTNDSTPPALTLGPSQIAGQRYTIREFLGAGGVGEVVAALDGEIRRVVALKTLQGGVRAEPLVAYRFVEEARITAQLEHPSIIPVYDLGTAPDGQPFYTMRVVKRRSLRDVLKRKELRAQWPMVRLLAAFQQVTRGLAYAHSRGVLHRDVKPENILLGDFGEVYLADWGLAKVQNGSQLILHGEGSQPPPGATDAGGTPGYMAPEILRDDWNVVDHRVDIFALGVVLYEILTGRGPFDSRTTAEVLIKTCEKDPPPPRDVNPQCPLLLEDLCLQMLHKDIDARPSSAEEVAERIEEYLEGAKERERKRQEALKLCERAGEPMRRFVELEEQRKALTERARALLKPIKGHEPLEKKRQGWTLEEQAERAEREAALVLAQAIELYTKALGYDAQSVDAHQGLADLYWSRARLAEQQRQAALQVYYEALVTEHDQGKFAALLRADARVSLTSNPSGAHVIAQRYHERDRLLVLGEERYLGRTPIKDARLEPGSYVITLKAPALRDTRYPLHLTRGAHHEANVNLYSDDEIGEGFVYVPAGVAIVGGDPEAYSSLAREEAEVADFAIARFPITFRQYCEFLDDLGKTDLDLALKRAPHDVRGSEGLVVRRAADGRWEPSDVVIEGEARKRFPPEDGHFWNVPVYLIDWFDARAFASWEAKRTGAPVRMPTELEWEKAARGVDGRFYPWGDRFDPTFCLMRESRPWVQQPEPIGTFPADESPYGVRDVAGGVREWVADIVGERTARELDAEAEPEAGTARDAASMRAVRSGLWQGDHKWSRCASRSTVFSALQRGSGLSFRLAKTLAPR
jgi:eukaryotic-like serine/threonine-protein kinase